ncbi:hypothetical protein [Nocardia paucivorans]|uniref:hypothetical protein n=1 Tax=Nocardia paucivorans TaxID=114259 RepID=UPI0012F85117|nr:hypothetical protein [Nocardia paucivorans]
MDGRFAIEPIRSTGSSYGERNANQTLERTRAAKRTAEQELAAAARERVDAEVAAAMLSTEIAGDSVGPRTVRGPPRPLLDRPRELAEGAEPAIAVLVVEPDIGLHLAFSGNATSVTSISPAASTQFSLTDLRRRVEAMLPRVDLPELVLEVMPWLPEFTETFTHL